MSDARRQTSPRSIPPGSRLSVLPREQKNATVIGAPTNKAGAQMLSPGKIDALATNKAILFEMSTGSSGSRVPERAGLRGTGGPAR